MTKKQSLNIDFDALFPGDVVTLYGVTISIKPLNIRQLSHLSKFTKMLLSECKSEGVTLENINDPESLVKLSVIIMDKCPELLSDVSNIELDDLNDLPIEAIIKILEKVIDVNLKSKEALEGNFNRLTEKLSALIPKQNEQ